MRRLICGFLVCIRHKQVFSRCDSNGHVQRARLEYWWANLTNISGTLFGCADQVPTCVEPNEHGTWLYGRDGWCDGRNVFPWVIDVTQQVQKGQQTNVIQYFGWFNGTDPDPKQNPGEMILYSYLVFYKELNKRWSIRFLVCLFYHYYTPEKISSFMDYTVFSMSMILWFRQHLRLW